MSQSRGKRRDLEFYRRGLEDLTSRLDAIDQLKYEHYETVAEHTRQVWSNILKRTTVGARAQVDILEKVSDKGLQNDCLGRMIASCGDPFDIVPLDIIKEIVPVQVTPRYASLVEELTIVRLHQLTSTSLSLISTNPSQPMQPIMTTKKISNRKSLHRRKP
jgi:hypothetical protein